VASAFDLGQGYGQFLAASEAAFAAGHYEVAYHALMAALHCAEQAADTDRLEEVAQVARRHQQALDAQSPSHRLSSQSSAQRGHRSVFEAGAVTAESARKRLEAAKVLERLRPPR